MFRTLFLLPAAPGCTGFRQPIDARFGHAYGRSSDRMRFCKALPRKSLDYSLPINQPERRI